MNRQHFEFEKSVRFNVPNETRTAREITLKFDHSIIIKVDYRK